VSKRSIFGKKSVQGLIVGITAATLALSLWGLGLLDTWEAKTWDWRASVMAKPGKATDDIRLVMLDQNSLDWAEKEMGLTWPWPREIYGAIVNYCRRSGTKALALDVLFTESSSYGVDDDAAFGNAVSEFGRLAGAVFLGKHSGSLTRWPSQIPSPDFKINGLKNWLNHTNPDDIVFPRATMAINELALNSAVLSNVQLNPDPDGVYRRTKLFSIFDDEVLPSLGLGAYLAAYPEVQIQIEPGKLTIGGKAVYIDRQGNVILRYRGPSGTHKAYSAAAVLQSEIRSISGEDPTISDKQAFKDKYVLFGFSAPGLYDLRSAPVGGVYTGVEIQRQFSFWRFHMPSPIVFDCSFGHSFGTGLCSIGLLFQKCRGKRGSQYSVHCRTSFFCPGSICKRFLATNGGSGGCCRFFNCHSTCSQLRYRGTSKAFYQGCLQAVPQPECYRTAHSIPGTSEVRW